MLETVGAMVVLVAGWVGAEPPPAAVRAGEPPVQVRAGVKVPDLNVGDVAPQLVVAKWIKGSSVTKFEPGMVYLVEFWATWCPPCRKNIPALSALSGKYKDKGLVVIGVSSQEQRGAADVEPFVAKMGDRIAYTIASDDENTATSAFLERAGIDGIPTAFLIDRTGRLAWIGKGFPMRGLEETVERVVSGSFDIEKAASAAKRRADIESRAKPMLANAEEAYGAGNFAKAVEWLELAIALDPPAMGQFVFDKFRLLAVEMKEYDKAYAFAAEQLDGPLKDEARVLNAISWTILDDPAIEKRDTKLALRLAERADSLTKSEAPEILDTLARALYETGSAEKAIEVQKKAVGLTDDAEFKAEMKGRLERYEGKK